MLGVLLAGTIAVSLRTPLVRPIIIGGSTRAESCDNAGRRLPMAALDASSDRLVLVLSDRCKACDDLVAYLAGDGVPIRRRFTTVVLGVDSTNAAHHPLRAMGSILAVRDGEDLRAALCTDATPVLAVVGLGGTVEQVLTGLDACAYALTGRVPRGGEGCSGCGGL